MKNLFNNIEKLGDNQLLEATQLLEAYTYAGKHHPRTGKLQNYLPEDFEEIGIHLTYNAYENKVLLQNEIGQTLSYNPNGVYLFDPE